MRTLHRTLITILGLVAALSLATAAESEKIRVAVVDFDTSAIRGTWRYGWSYHNLERAAADNLATELVKTGRFRVIERQQLDKILAEQNLGDTARVDASTAARIGKILGVQLVVIGGVSEFGISEKGGKIPQVGKWKWGRGVGGKLVTGKSSLNARLVDTTTAEILGAYEASGSHKFGSAEFAGAKAGTKWDSGMASKVLAEAVEDLARNIAKGANDLSPSTTRGGLEAKIAKVGSGTVYLNIGSASGVKAGDRFEIRSMGDAIIDPDTGESLGGVESDVGVVEITKVINERLSEARIVEGSGFAVGNRALMK